MSDKTGKRLLVIFGPSPNEPLQENKASLFASMEKKHICDRSPFSVADYKRLSTSANEVHLLSRRIKVMVVDCVF